MFNFKKNKQTTEKKQENKSWISRLKAGLGKSSSKINEGFKDIFIRKKLDEETLEKLEDILIMADIGINTSSKIIDKLRKDKFDKEVNEDEIKKIISDKIEEILSPVAKSPEIDCTKKPFVMLICGVNGSGKTTTIGKYGKIFKDQGKSVMYASCDTYRAAAVEQLEVWANKTGCLIEKGHLNADPASVAYTAYKNAKEKNIDILIIDTAGRLHNKTNLMEQLAKIKRVINKIDETAPHESIIVLDATTGQNAINQVKTFNETIDLSAMIITKLDGTAKGGVVVNLAQQFNLPVYSIGVGEAIDDLQPFKACDFASSLVGLENKV